MADEETPGTDVSNWVDKAMYEAAPMQSRTPKVTLLHASQDPLGQIAAASKMYKGETTYDLHSVTDDERRDCWDNVLKTHLQAPLEFVHLHFMIEGVTRAFTHQLVRQRTAVYAQESLRFAVKTHMADEVSYPPSLLDPGAVEGRREWESAMQQAEGAYHRLIAMGIPAEDARGLLPHAVTTRVHYGTNLRSLMEHAGNRLCTQAQFEWRTVFMGIMNAIRTYASFLADQYSIREAREWRPVEGVNVAEEATHGLPVRLASDANGRSTIWQWKLIAKEFRPVCFARGHCPFHADWDRGCTIRERVDKGEFDKIDPEEWLFDPQAGWVR